MNEEFEKWWGEYGHNIFYENEKGTLETAWLFAWQAATERAANAVDEEITDFLNEAPPGCYDKHLAETVEFLRGVMLDAIRKG